MLGNMDDYLDKLEWFILKHHKSCDRLDCTCEAVLKQLSDKAEKSES